MRKVMMAVASVMVMFSGCWLQVAPPPKPPGWEDPQTVIALVDSIFGHLRDVLDSDR